nr:MAG TPA: hypothetical protein [Caudoviricetes sp.]
MSDNITELLSSISVLNSLSDVRDYILRGSSLRQLTNKSIQSRNITLILVDIRLHLSNFLRVIAAPVSNLLQSIEGLRSISQHSGNSSIGLILNGALSSLITLELGDISLSSIDIGTQTSNSGLVSFSLSSSIAYGLLKSSDVLLQTFDSGRRRLIPGQLIAFAILDDLRNQALFPTSRLYIVSSLSLGLSDISIILSAEILQSQNFTTQNDGLIIASNRLANFLQGLIALNRIVSSNIVFKDSENHTKVVCTVRATSIYSSSGSSFSLSKATKHSTYIQGECTSRVKAYAKVKLIGYRRITSHYILPPFLNLNIEGVSLIVSISKVTDVDLVRLSGIAISTLNVNIAHGESRLRLCTQTIDILNRSNVFQSSRISEDNTQSTDRDGDRELGTVLRSIHALSQSTNSSRIQSTGLRSQSAIEALTETGNSGSSCSRLRTSLDLARGELILGVGQRHSTISISSLGSDLIRSLITNSESIKLTSIGSESMSISISDFPCSSSDTGSRTKLILTSIQSSSVGRSNASTNLISLILRSRNRNRRLSDSRRLLLNEDSVPSINQILTTDSNICLAIGQSNVTDSRSSQQISREIDILCTIVAIESNPVSAIVIVSGQLSLIARDNLLYDTIVALVRSSLTNSLRDRSTLINSCIASKISKGLTRINNLPISAKGSNIAFLSFGHLVHQSRQIRGCNIKTIFLDNESITLSLGDLNGSLDLVTSTNLNGSTSSFLTDVYIDQIANRNGDAIGLCLVEVEDNRLSGGIILTGVNKLLQSKINVFTKLVTRSIQQLELTSSRNVVQLATKTIKYDGLLSFITLSGSQNMLSGIPAQRRDNRRGRQTSQSSSDVSCNSLTRNRGLAFSSHFRSNSLNDIGPLFTVMNITR